MEPRNWIGIILLICGVVVQPIGWMFYFQLQILSFVLIFLGVFILIVQKRIQAAEEKEFSLGSSRGHAIPGDAHGYSGWDEGGRSDSWKSSSAGDSGDGGGGGGD